MPAMRVSKDRPALLAGPNLASALEASTHAICKGNSDSRSRADDLAETGSSPALPGVEEAGLLVWVPGKKVPAPRVSRR